MPNDRNFQRQFLRRFEIRLVIIYTVKVVENVKTFLYLSPVSKVMTICILLHKSKSHLRLKERNCLIAKRYGV